ncbi:hypothetical protein HO173_000114 [Letharia columbiana]|uniref:Multiple myeloma tumor-associated protein 2-like N-terminal domain-containing protein n=1 Tax=Letharia columbiana TaxID=112416 RepID=A0A8H6G6Q8_9LECA|nr:uncharacterized protein HO173_000114 [Letharia columbiana]KAF6241404.1 hypothetical protein HO173_000114 [Letharia columbiana]
MDLVAGVRKEGSRGGRGEFKWEDVRDSQHRENYLGHSLMAPVGRWQKNKDLNWYAKGDTSAAALSAAEARKEEIRRIKEAEESALSEALGYGPTIRSNANETPIGRKEVEKAIKETAEGDDEEGAKGVGFGAFLGGAPVEEERDVLRGEGLDRPASKVVIERRRDGDSRKEKRRRSKSRDRSSERRHRRHTYGEERSHRRHRSRDRSHRRQTDRSRERYSHGRERSRSYERRRDKDRQPRRPRERSYSPDPPRRRRDSRDRDYDYRR